MILVLIPAEIVLSSTREMHLGLNRVLKKLTALLPDLQLPLGSNRLVLLDEHPQDIGSRQPKTGLWQLFVDVSVVDGGHSTDATLRRGLDCQRCWPVLRRSSLLLF